MQGLHLTPIQPHSELSRTLEKNKKIWSYHHAITYLCSLNSAPLYVCFKKEHPPTPWQPPEPTKAIHLTPPLCRLVFVTMGLPKVSYSGSSGFFQSIYPGSKWGCGHRAGKGLNTTGGQEQLPGEPNTLQENMVCHATALPQNSQH